MVTLFGFELEGVWNKKHIENNNVNIQGYHHGSFHSTAGLSSWKVETDSSLHSDGEFDKTTVCEFISRLISIDDISNAVQELKEFFDRPLEEVVAFNSSTGCHVHFSDTAGDSETFVTYHYLKKLRNAVMTRVQKELPQVYETFKEQYYRNYAQSVDKYNEIINKAERSLEFNLTDIRKGIEWRSFNLVGVKTWEELERMLKIASEEINNVLEEYRSNNKEETIVFEITADVIESNKVIIRTEDE